MIRQIIYTVDENGISPSTKQRGGVQGDHRATEIVFLLEEMLYNNISEQAEGKRLIYRFDAYDGEGGVVRSDITDLTGNTIRYFLEKWLTKCGGIIKVVLVISIIQDDSTEMELYSFPAILQLKNLPDGRVVEKEEYESISTLVEGAKKSAEKATMEALTAEEAAGIATEAMENTQLAKAELAGGSEWVFDGGNATTNVDIEFVIDSEFIEGSKNPVESKVIKEYIDKKSADYVIELGNEENWNYRKWNSGLAECWGASGLISPEEEISNGGQFIHLLNLPITFDKIFEVSLTSDYRSYAIENLKVSEKVGYPYSQLKILVQINTETGVGPDSPVSFTFGIVGRWK